MKLLILLLILLSSCQQSNLSPTQTVEQFFNKFVAQKLDSSDIDQLTTDGLRDFFTDEKIKEMKSITPPQKFKIRFIHESCSKESCSISFEISTQLDSQNSETIKKIAILKNFPETTWKISSIQNVKTSFKFEDIQIKAED